MGSRFDFEGAGLRISSFDSYGQNFIYFTEENNYCLFIRYLSRAQNNEVQNFTLYPSNSTTLIGFNITKKDIQTDDFIAPATRDKYVWFTYPVIDTAYLINGIPLTADSKVFRIYLGYGDEDITPIFGGNTNLP